MNNLMIRVRLFMLGPKVLTALKHLVFPNVPSADDVRLLLVLGNAKPGSQVMQTADRVEAAQEEARRLIKRLEGKG